MDERLRHVERSPRGCYGALSRDLCQSRFSRPEKAALEVDSFPRILCLAVTTPSSILSMGRRSEAWATLSILCASLSAPRPMHTQARGLTEPEQSHVDA